MGVLNVTPDSFSDGGRFLDADAALAHGRAWWPTARLCSTWAASPPGPGASRSPSPRSCAGCSRSSRRSPTRCRPSRSTPARRPWPEPRSPPAPRWSTTCPPRCGPVAAELGVGWVAMHMPRASPRTMQDDPRYDDVVAEVVRLPRRAGGRAPMRRRRARGLDRSRDRVRQDAGAQPRRCSRTSTASSPPGCPVLVGTSRKAFLGLRCSATSDWRRSSEPAGPSDDRLEASLATATWAMAHGAAMVRVHDVRPTRTGRTGHRRARSSPRTLRMSVPADEGARACAGEGQVGAGHPAPQLPWVISRTSSPSASDPAAMAPTTAGCAARRRSSGSASRGSPASSR